MLLSIVFIDWRRYWSSTFPFRRLISSFSTNWSSLMCLSLLLASWSSIISLIKPSCLSTCLSRADDSIASTAMSKTDSGLICLTTSIPVGCASALAQTVWPAWPPCSTWPGSSLLGSSRSSLITRTSTVSPWSEMWLMSLAFLPPLTPPASLSLPTLPASRSDRSTCHCLALALSAVASGCW